MISYDNLPIIVQTIMLEEQLLQSLKSDPEVFRRIIYAGHSSGGFEWVYCRLGNLGTSEGAYQNAWTLALESGKFYEIEKIYSDYFDNFEKNTTIEQNGEKFVI